MYRHDMQSTLRLFLPAIDIPSVARGCSIGCQILSRRTGVSRCVCHGGALRPVASTFMKSL